MQSVGNRTDCTLTSQLAVDAIKKLDNIKDVRPKAKTLPPYMYSAQYIHYCPILADCLYALSCAAKVVG